MNMRVKKSIENISTIKVKSFYEQRAAGYKGSGNVYNVTMLQDKNPSLSEERHKAEVYKLLPKLKIDSDSCVLDLACGVGRWLDALPETINKYRGIDFTEGLIEIAQSRNIRHDAKFFTGSVLEADKILVNEKHTFNRVLMIAFFMYMNDNDVLSLLKKIPALITDFGGELICMKASIGIQDRLTLKDFYSEELKSEYEAIYRTRDDYMKFFEATLIHEGFSVTDEGFMFDESLNNRKETAQYYFILER